MKFETVQIHFLSDFLIRCHPEILATWRNNFSSLLQVESLEGQT